MSRFFKGTLVLIVAGFLTKILGFVNRIVLARYVGEEGVGLFMMAMPTLFLVIAITQMGLPVAISKLVAEASAKRDTRRMKQILVVSLTITITLSLIFTPLLIVLAKYLSVHFFTDERIYYPLIAIAPIVPISAVSAVLRGYFQGKQQMNPYAISLVLEQLVRISLIALLTNWLLPYGISYAAAGAIAATILGEFSSMIYLLLCFELKKKFRLHTHFFHYFRSGRQAFHDLMQIAIPTTGSRMVGSIAWFLEPIVVAQCLALSGVTAVTATKLYGELTGYAMPLLMLPSFITVSIGTSLVPAISEAYTQGKYRLVEFQLQQSLRFTFLTGALSVVVIYVLADPLMLLMFGDDHAAIYVRFLAPFFVFFFYQGPLQSALQAMNMATAAMVNSFVGALVKTVLIFVLASRPHLGIMGVAVSLGVGMVLITFLHFFSISRKIHVPIYLREYVLTALIMFGTGYLGELLYKRVFVQFALIQKMLLTSCIMCIVFLILLAITGLVSKDEIRRVPIAGRFLAWVFVS